MRRKIRLDIKSYEVIDPIFWRYVAPFPRPLAHSRVIVQVELNSTFGKVEEIAESEERSGLIRCSLGGPEDGLDVFDIPVEEKSDRTRPQLNRCI